jgi:hypothetical protein
VERVLDGLEVRVERERGAFGEQAVMQLEVIFRRLVERRRV